MTLERMNAQANTDAFTENTQQVLGTVTGDNVRIRKTPEIIQEENHVIGKLSNGNRVEILEEVLPAGKMIPWYKIKSGAITGWMRSDFILKD